MDMRGNFGFIHEKLEIKIFILFILRRLPEPVTLDVLAELAMCDGGISYFDLAECVAELVKTEHLCLADNKYTLTQKGVRNGETTEISLPYSVRKEAEDAASAIRAALNRNTMIRTSHSKSHDGGCMVELSLSDGIGEVVSIELFAANEKQALLLENGFRKKAENIYNALIEMILE